MTALKPKGRQDWIDLGMGVGFSLMGTLELTFGGKFHFASGGLAVALCVMTALPLALRRRAPLVVSAVILVALILTTVLHQASPFGSFFAFLVNVYSVASVRGRAAGSLNAAATAVVIAPHLFDSGTHPDPGDFLFTFVPVVIALTLGILANQRILHIGALQAEVSVADQLAEERAQRATAEERARIARELHDVVAHRMSVITMQAAAARRVTDGQPRVALEALAAIETQSREALAEMRRLLDVMRLHGDDGPELAPQPGLAGLDDLAVSVRAAGVPLDVTVRGTARPLSPGLDLSAYRIIQEALTNVIKHTAGAETRVLVNYGAMELELEVVSRGAARPAAEGLASGGHGLVGMRERAALFGGRVKAGPEAGGYRVHALLPIDAKVGAG